MIRSAGHSPSRQLSHARFVTAGLTIIVAVLGAWNCVSGQERAPLQAVVPSQPAFYFWTDDFPELLDRVDSLDWKPLDALQQAWDLDPKLIRNAREAARVERELDLLHQIRDEMNADIFDRQAMFIRSFDAENSPIDVIILDSSAADDRIISLMQNIDELLLGPQDSAEPETTEESTVKDVVANELNRLHSEPLYWTMVDGRLCLSSNEKAVEHLRPILAGKSKALTPLSEDKRYATTLALASLDADAPGGIQFYVHPDVVEHLRLLALYCFRAPSSPFDEFFRLREQRSILGISGNFYLGNDEKLNRANTQVYGDALIQISQPPFGITRAISSGGKLNFDFEAPDLELLSLQMMSIDGAELAKLSREQFDHTEFETNPEASVKILLQKMVEKAAGTTSLPMWIPSLAMDIDQIVHLSGRPEEDLELRKNVYTDNAQHLSWIHFADGSRPVELLDTALKLVVNQMFNVAEANRATALTKQSNEDETIWSFSREHKLSSISGAEENSDEYYRTRSENAERELLEELGRSPTKLELQERLDIYRRIADLIIFAAQDLADWGYTFRNQWFTSAGHSLRDPLEAIESNRRIRRLQKVVEAIGDAHREVENPAFVSVLWRPYLLRLLDLSPWHYAKGQRDQFTKVELREDANAKTVKRQQFLARRISFLEQMFEKLEMLVITGTVAERKGFQLRFALVVPSDEP